MASQLEWGELASIGACFMVAIWLLLWHTARYGEYLKIIYDRLQVLESTTLKGQLELHTSIKKADKKALRKWKGFGKLRSLKYLKILMFLLLITTWIMRVFRTHLPEIF